MHTYFSTFSASTLRRCGLVVGAMSVAFALGIQTAGDVQPLVEPTKAGIRLSGDINGDGILDAADAHAALDIARGLRTATESELEADTNQDFRITLDDVAFILNAIERR